MLRARQIAKCVASLGRVCNTRNKSTSSDKEPEVCQTITGAWVPYPKGRTNRLILPVSRVGVEAVQLGPVEDEMSLLYNKAKNHYLEKRSGLLTMFAGKWVAFGSDGVMIEGDTEMAVKRIAEVFYPIHKDEYYLNCLGKEVVCAVVMDNSYAMQGNTVLHNALKGNDFFVEAEFYDGIQFVSQPMKHDSGATMLGVPLTVLSNMHDNSLVRAGELDSVGPFTRIDGQRCYHNFRIRIAGLETRTTVIQSREFLVGYPVLARYESVLNVDNKHKVTMRPLPGRADGDDCTINLS